MDLLVNGIRNLKLFDSTLFHLEDTNATYREYIDKLLQLDPKKLKYFLLTLKIYFYLEVFNIARLHLYI